MIKIRYVPPSAASQATDARPGVAAWGPDEVAFNPFTTEEVRLTQGTRSRLALDGVGTRGRRRRNERDTLALSKEWRELASRAGGDSWQTLHDATTALGADGQPNMGALRQAQRQLRQWFYQKRQADGVTPEVQAQAARVDALIDRLIHRNFVSGLGLRADAGRGGPPGIQGRDASRMQAVLDFLRPERRSAAALHRKGMRLWMAGRPEAGLAALEAAADKDPKSARIRLDLGRVLADEGHYAEAECTLLTADELAPRRSAPQLALGELYIDIGQPLMAIEAFKTAVARNPSDTDAHAHLGVAYYEQGDLASATPHLQKAVALDQQCVVARFYLAQISLQENDLLRARFQLGMVAKLDPEMDLSRFNQSHPPALANRATGKTAPLHHWQMPIRTPTTTLKKSPTGPLGNPGTSALVDSPANGG